MSKFIEVIVDNDNGKHETALINTDLIACVALDDLGVTTIYDNEGNGMCVVHTMTDMKLKLGMCNIV